MNEHIQHEPFEDGAGANAGTLDRDPFDDLEVPVDLDDPDDLDDLDGARDLEDVDDVDAVDDDGEALTRDVLDELSAVSEAEAGELVSARAALEAERARSRVILERYRAAALAGEPDLPPELVHGGSLEELEASLASARATVEGVRRRLEQSALEGADRERGFPAGAPARGGTRPPDLSAGEKIRYGLEQRARE